MVAVSLSPFNYEQNLWLVMVAKMRMRKMFGAVTALSLSLPHLPPPRNGHCNFTPQMLAYEHQRADITTLCFILFSSNCI